MKCFNCGKGILYGNNVSHSKRRTKRVFKPNLHDVRIIMGGNRKKVRLCTKCLRLYKKHESLAKDIASSVEIKESPVSQVAA